MIEDEVQYHLAKEWIGQFDAEVARLEAHPEPTLISNAILEATRAMRDELAADLVTWENAKGEKV